MIRVLSGIVMAAGALAVILFLPPVGLRVVVSILAAMAAFEYMGDRKSTRLNSSH